MAHCALGEREKADAVAKKLDPVYQETIRRACEKEE